MCIFRVLFTANLALRVCHPVKTGLRMFHIDKVCHQCKYGDVSSSHYSVVGFVSSVSTNVYLQLTIKSNLRTSRFAVVGFVYRINTDMSLQVQTGHGIFHICTVSLPYIIMIIIQLYFRQQPIDKHTYKYSTVDYFTQLNMYTFQL